MRIRGPAAVLVGAIASLCGIVLAPARSLGGPGDPWPEASFEHREQGGMLLLGYRWVDENTLRVVERQGDTLVIDPTVVPVGLRAGVVVDRRRLDQVVSSFGVPEPWLSFRYSSEADRRQKLDDLERRSNDRGFTMGRDFVARPVWRWVVEQSREDLRSASSAIKTAATGAGYDDARELLGAYASFVQSLEYRIDPDFRPASDGTRILTGGVTMPLETLATGRGDCDTRCALLASLLASTKGTSVIFLEGQSHAFVGLLGAPRQGDRYVTVQGLQYVLVELTSPMPVGWIPDDLWRGLQRNQFRVTPIL